MSFGFSVGDFIAVGKLTSDIIGSLQTVGGAKSEYQELIRELESLQTALHYLDRLDDKKSPSKHVQSIKCAALMCRYPLEEFQANIKKYEDSLGLWTRSNPAKRAKDKLSWTFGEKDGIKRLRSYLSLHIETINNMLLQHGLERMDLIGQEAEENLTQIRTQVENTTTALGNVQRDTADQTVMLRTMHSMLGTLCKVVGGEIVATLQQLSQVITTVCISTQQMYTILLEIRDAGDSVDTRFTYFQAPYRFEDARGFVYPVPSEFSFEEIENMILYKFRTGAGARDVQNGNYEFCNTKRRSERITATTRLRPGVSITMAIIITKSATDDADSVCPMPRCTSSNIAKFHGGGFQCLDCDVWFDEARKDPRRVEDDDDREYDAEDSLSETDSQSTDDDEDMDSDGITGLRNVTWATELHYEDDLTSDVYKELLEEDNLHERSNPGRGLSRVSRLAEHFERLSREFQKERERERKARRQRTRMPYPVERPRPIVEVYEDLPASPRGRSSSL